jgi:cell division protein FtsL
MTEPFRSRASAAAQAVEDPVDDDFLGGSFLNEVLPDDYTERPQPAEPAPASPDGPRHLRVVAPRRRLRMPSARILFLAGSGVVIAVAFGLVYLHVVMAQRQFQLDDLSTKLTQEQTQYQQYRVEVAELNSPARIIATAEGKLGMRQPASVTYLKPPPGSSTSGESSGLAAPPTPGKNGTIPAPEGDADWPAIKADLAGSP